MKLLLVLSIAIRLICVVWSLVLWRRIKNWRLVFLALFFAMMVLRQSMTFFKEIAEGSAVQWLDLSEFPGLVVSLMGLFILFSLNRLLIEHNSSLDLREVVKNLQDRIQVSSQQLEVSRRQVENLFANSPVALMEVDLSEVHQSLHELNLEGEALRAHLKANPDLMLTYTKQIKLVSSNSAAIELFEIKDGVPDIPGTFRKRDHDSFINEIVSLRRGVVSYSYEVETTNEQGVSHFLEVSWSLVPGYEKPYERLLVTCKDRTEEVQALNELQISEKRYRDLFESATDLITIQDDQGKVLYANQAFSQTMGYDPQVAPISIFKFVHEAYHEPCREAMRQLIRGEPAPSMQLTLRTAHGNVVMVEGTVTASRENGRVRTVQSIFRNVTERIRMEQEVQMAQEMTTTTIHNIGNLLNSVNVSTQTMLNVLDSSRLPSLVRCKELLEAQGDNLGHFLTADPRGQKIPQFFMQAPEKLQKEYDALRAENERLRNKVALIEQIARPQQAMAVANSDSKTNLADIIREALEIQLSEHHRIKVELDLGDQCEGAYPKVAIMHVFLNLLKNAKEALMEVPPGERIINISHWQCPDTGCVKVSVRDNGGGILPEDLGKMFTHGFTTKADGHGFGLNYCARVIRELGGDIQVESEGAGKGCCFLLSFPSQNTNVKPV